MATQRWASQEVIEALDSYPCFRCLSDEQLILVLALLLCRITSTDRDNECTAAELMEQSVCSNCFSRRQLLQSMVAQIATYAANNQLVTDIDAMIQEAVCLNCADPRKLLGMVVLQVLRGIDNGTLFNPAR